MSNTVGVILAVIITYGITVGSWIGVAYLAGLIFNVTPSYIIVAIIATVLYVLNALFVLGGRAK